jgi:hypothetical protein
MQKWNLGSLLTSVLLGTTVTLLACSDGWAQQKRSFTFKSGAGESKYTQQLVIDVGDIPGHHIRILELHFTPDPANPVVYEGLRVKEGWARGTSDYVNGTGRASGYSHEVLENGDKIFWQWSGTLQSVEETGGKRKAEWRGTSVIVGGTGKMRGIRGTSRDVRTVEFEGGKAVSNQGDGVTEYWFEQ